MKKDISEMVFPVENYTDKIHIAIKMMFSLYPHLSFTISQMKEHLERGYPWLKNPTKHRSDLLNRIIKTGITKLIQLNKVKKVTSSVSVESQWQSASTVAESGFTNITSESGFARTELAMKAVNRRAIGGRSLIRLNELRPSCRA